MPDRHLLVDAYNVIHAWPDLRAALLHHGPEAARALLADALRPLHDSAGWRVSLVFDGQGPDLLIERPGPELTFSHIHAPSGLTADAIIEQIVLNSTLSTQSLSKGRPQSSSPQPSSSKTSRQTLSMSKGKKFPPSKTSNRRKKYPSKPATAGLPSEASAKEGPTLHPDKEIVVVTRDNLLSEATAAAGARTLSPDGLRDWAQNCAAQQTRTLLNRHSRSQSRWQSAPSPWGKLTKPPAF
jgi:hypothetical protein